jgi:TRAP-type C4-dicarboxylate transport system permease small subunit
MWRFYFTITVICIVAILALLLEGGIEITKKAFNVMMYHDS